MRDVASVGGVSQCKNVCRRCRKKSNNCRYRHVGCDKKRVQINVKPDIGNVGYSGRDCRLVMMDLRGIRPDVEPAPGQSLGSGNSAYVVRTIQADDEPDSAAFLQ